MDYKKLSDQELNMLVAAYACKGHSITPSVYNSKAAAIAGRWGHESVFMAVNRPEDSFHLITKERIAVIPHGKTQWMAYHESGISVTDRNPLKAAMIIYLMIKEELHDGHYPAEEIH
jgi:hypothetical protein